MITVEHLSSILYHFDIAGTTCKYHDNMLDEYDIEAERIIKLLKLGIPFRTALYETFIYYFSIGNIIGTEYEVTLIETIYYNQTIAL